MLLAVVLCMTAFTVPAFAGADPGEQSGGLEPQDTHSEEQTGTVETTETKQTATVDVVTNPDGTRTVTIGDQTWRLDAEDATLKQTGRVVNVYTYLHLRTGPSTDYSIIGHLLNGTEVEVIGEKGGWYEIVIPEQTGYVCGKYLEVLPSSTGSGTVDRDSTNELLELLLHLLGVLQVVPEPFRGALGLQLVALPPGVVQLQRGAQRLHVALQGQHLSPIFLEFDHTVLTLLRPGMSPRRDMDELLTNSYYTRIPASCKPFPAPPSPFPGRAPACCHNLYIK